MNFLQSASIALYCICGECRVDGWIVGLVNCGARVERHALSYYSNYEFNRDIGNGGRLNHNNRKNILNNQHERHRAQFHHSSYAHWTEDGLPHMMLFICQKRIYNSITSLAHRIIRL